MPLRVEADSMEPAMAGRPFLTAKSTISCPTEYDVSMSTMVFDS